MSMAFGESAEKARLRTGEIERKTRRIHRASVSDFVSRGGANFTALRSKDLERLFDQYDRLFFQGELRRRIAGRPLAFRVSTRMTKAAGKTIHRRLRGKASRDEFEIAISSTLLLQTFRDVERSITVSGLECRDRLEALQRILEHELVHLLELLVWDRSSCSAKRFQSLARQLFGHESHTHELITPRERALKRFGIRLGDRVTFRARGQRREGFVNRITKRATVLVENERGRRYSDGKRYERFYVRLSMLQAVGR